MVTIPCMRGVSEAVECTPMSHGIATAVRPYKALHQLLAHPKDKTSVQKSAGVIYSIPWKDCPMVYIGETGRRLQMGGKKHKQDLKQLEGMKFTRARRTESLTKTMSWVRTTWSTGRENPCKRTRLEEERGERSHLHQEGGDACDQLWQGVSPSSRSLLEVVVPQDLHVVSWHIHSSDED